MHSINILYASCHVCLFHQFLLVRTFYCVSMYVMVSIELLASCIMYGSLESWIFYIVLYHLNSLVDKLYGNSFVHFYILHIWCLHNTGAFHICLKEANSCMIFSNFLLCIHSCNAWFCFSISEIFVLHQWSCLLTNFDLYECVNIKIM